MPPRPSAVMSVPADTTATATSAVFTDPIAYRGGRPRCSRNGVTTGPQAPTRPLVTPPATAATSTPGTSNCGARREASSSAAPSGEVGSALLKRNRMRSPTNINRIARIGRISSPSTFDRTSAPIRAPTAPGCRQPHDQTVIDVFEPPVRHSGRQPTRDLGEVDRRGRGSGTDPRRQQDGRGGRAEAHAQRAVHHGGEKPGERDERQLTHLRRTPGQPQRSKRCDNVRAGKCQGYASGTAEGGKSLRRTAGYASRLLTAGAVHAQQQHAQVQAAAMDDRTGSARSRTLYVYRNGCWPVKPHTLALARSAIASTRLLDSPFLFAVNVKTS